MGAFGHVTKDAGEAAKPVAQNKTAQPDVRATRM